MKIEISAQEAKILKELIGQLIQEYTEILNDVHAFSYGDALKFKDYIMVLRSTKRKISESQRGKRRGIQH